MKPGITVVLNCYKRVAAFDIQLSAVESQTVKPQRIIVWKNSGGESIPIDNSRYLLIDSSENFGVWARFSIALLAETEFVCVFDDDTIPGPRWFENCLATLKDQDGLLGTRGVIFKSHKRYHPHIDVGWRAPNHRTTRVDIVGHSWFFRRAWLASYWAEMVDAPEDLLAGEDVHFSYVLQKCFGLGTYVPPHPQDNHDFWGSLPGMGMHLGADENAISVQVGSLDKFDRAMKSYLSRGFKLICSENLPPNGDIFVGRGIRRQAWLVSWLRRRPRLFKLARITSAFLERRGIHI